MQKFRFNPPKFHMHKVAFICHIGVISWVAAFNNVKANRTHELGIESLNRVNTLKTVPRSSATNASLFNKGLALEKSPQPEFDSKIDTKLNNISFGIRVLHGNLNVSQSDDFRDRPTWNLTLVCIDQNATTTSVQYLHKLDPHSDIQWLNITERNGNVNGSPEFSTSNTAEGNFTTNSVLLDAVQSATQATTVQTLVSSDTPTLEFGLYIYRGSVAEMAPSGTKISMQPEEIHAVLKHTNPATTYSTWTVRYSISGVVCCPQCDESDKKSISDCNRSLIEINPQNGTLFLLRQAPVASQYTKLGKQPKFDVVVEASTLNENNSASNKALTALATVHVWLQQPLSSEQLENSNALRSLRTPKNLSFTFAYKVAEFPAPAATPAPSNLSALLTRFTVHHLQKRLKASRSNGKTAQHPSHNNTVFHGSERLTGHPYFIASASRQPKIISSSALGGQWAPDWQITVFPQPHVTNSTANHGSNNKQIRVEHIDSDGMTAHSELLGREANIASAPDTRQSRQESDADIEAFSLVENQMEITSINKDPRVRNKNQTFLLAGDRETVVAPFVLSPSATSSPSKLTSNWSWLFNIADARTALAISLTVFACILLIIVGILSATLTRASRKRRIVRPFNQRPSAIADLHRRSTILPVNSTIRTSVTPPQPSPTVQIELTPVSIPGSSPVPPPLSAASTLSSNETCASLSTPVVTRQSEAETKMTTVPKDRVATKDKTNIDNYKTAYCRAAAERRQNRTQQRFVISTATTTRRQQQDRAKRLNWFNRGASSTMVAPSSNGPALSLVPLTTNKERLVLPPIPTTATVVTSSTSQRRLRSL